MSFSKNLLNRTILYSITATVILSLSIHAAALPAAHFPSQSITSSGKWMKVAVKESGVYELTFDELREMGFSNPEEVGIYGYSFYQMPEDFTDSEGNPLIPGQANSVPAIHVGDKLVFYAQGVEKLSTVKTSGNFKPYAFDRAGRNIYSTYVWYLLADKGFTEMTTADADNVDESTTTLLTYGVDYAYHENPQYHCYFDDGTTHGANTGRYYYGELLSGESVTIPVKLPGIVSNNYAQVKGAIFFEPYEYDKDEKRDGCSIKFGSGFAMSVQADRDFYVKPQNFSFSINNPSSSLNALFSKASGSSNRFSHLNYFVISYNRHIPSSFNSFDQAHLMFTNLSANQTGYFNLPSENICGFDITVPGNPRLLSPSGETRRVTLTNTSGFPEIVLFDADKELKKVQAKIPVENSNLHQRATEGAEMLIVCVPALKDAAQRFADIHAATDGVKTMVATTTEIYDNFSAGTPDPMAIRSLVKMMSENGNVKLKNILLMGPYRSNPRLIGHNADEPGAVELPSDPANSLPEFNCIIAWQEDGIYSPELGADSFAEFYALTDDVIPDKYYETKPLIGVGVLPCNTLEEADNIITKIEHFLKDDTHAYSLNRMVAIGGTGDDQLHSQCAVEALDVTGNCLDNAMVGTPLIIDAYPKGDGTNRFVDAVNQGCILSTYFGHGSSLQMSEHFFNASDISKMKNTRLPFMTFFGCDITQTDRLIRGIGEKMILNTDRGLLGGLVSIRKTHDNVNRNIFSYFINAMTRDLSKTDAPARLRPLSLGEATSAWKSNLEKSENGRYILIGDPSLILPLPTLGISATAVPADGRKGYVTLKGNILDPDGKALNDFNGKCVIRLLAPATTVDSKNYISASQTPFHFTLQDSSEAIKEADVADGSFEITFPMSKQTQASDILTFALSAYDPSQRLAAASRIDQTGISAEAADLSSDLIAPNIDILYYDAKNNSVVVEVSDDFSLTLAESPLSSNLALFIDGKHLSAANSAQAAYIEDNHYRKTVGLPLLSDGQHIVRAMARDDAGNETWREITFITGNAPGSLQLQLSENALYDKITISVENNSGSENVYLYVENAESEILDVLPIGNEFEWDGTLNDGSSLPTGVYRLHVKDPAGDFSPAIDLPIVKTKLNTNN